MNIKKTAPSRNWKSAPSDTALTPSSTALSDIDSTKPKASPQTRDTESQSKRVGDSRKEKEVSAVVENAVIASGAAAAATGATVAAIGVTTTTVTAGVSAATVASIGTAIGGTVGGIAGAVGAGVASGGIAAAAGGVGGALGGAAAGSAIATTVADWLGITIASTATAVSAPVWAIPTAIVGGSAMLGMVGWKAVKHYRQKKDSSRRKD